MGISPKTETRCHNFSFFGRQDFQKRDFRKTRNCGSAFQFLGKSPYPIGAPRALRRSLSVGLRYRFSVLARTDCRLAKFRGLMIKGKYGAVIGPKTRFFGYVPSMDFQAVGSLKPITAPYLPLSILPRNFAKRQCKLQWLIPHIPEPLIPNSIPRKLFTTP